MTNEQLAILLKAYVLELERAVEKAEDALPSSVERIGEWEYIGTDQIAAAQSNRDIDPKLWKLVDGDAVCLEAVRAVIQMMEHNALVLYPVWARIGEKSGTD